MRIGAEAVIKPISRSSETSDQPRSRTRASVLRNWSGLVTVCRVSGRSHDAEVRNARQVLDALATAHRETSGAVELDGQMIDEAVAVAARRTLAKAGAA